MPRDAEANARRTRKYRASYRHDLKALADEDGISQVEELRRLLLREKLVRDMARH
jgi:hypothetical protein